MAWALQTADALWKRGERVDAVVWVRRAAQAAGEGEDAKRAATLARHAAELGDWIATHALTGASVNVAKRPPNSSLEALDELLGGDAPAIRSVDLEPISMSDVEIVSARDFEAGFGPRRRCALPLPPKPSAAPYSQAAGLPHRGAHRERRRTRRS